MPTKPALWTQIHPPKQHPKKPYRVRKVSVKRVKLNREYAKVKREWKNRLVESNHWDCRRCGRCPSDSPHHYQGRAGVLLCYDPFFVPLCIPCHNWVDQNREKARTEGFLCPKGDWGRQPPINGRCNGCGCRISKETEWCGECLCETDEL